MSLRQFRLCLIPLDWLGDFVLCLPNTIRVWVRKLQRRQIKPMEMCQNLRTARPLQSLEKVRKSLLLWRKRQTKKELCLFAIKITSQLPIDDFGPYFMGCCAQKNFFPFAIWPTHSAIWFVAFVSLRASLSLLQRLRKKGLHDWVSWGCQKLISACHQTKLSDSLKNTWNIPWHIILALYQLVSIWRAQQKKWSTPSLQLVLHSKRRCTFRASIEHKILLTVTNKKKLTMRTELAFVVICFRLCILRAF